MTGINDYIDSEVKSSDVVLFMKGTPGFPQCGFSGQVVQILDYLGVDYKGINVLTSSDLRQGIKDYSNWPTIPQLYVKGEFVGGCDIIREMFQAGELQSFLGEKGISVSSARRVPDGFAFDVKADASVPTELDTNLIIDLIVSGKPGKRAQRSLISHLPALPIVIDPSIAP